MIGFIAGAAIIIRNSAHPIKLFERLDDNAQLLDPACAAPPGKTSSPYNSREIVP